MMHACSPQPASDGALVIAAAARDQRQDALSLVLTGAVGGQVNPVNTFLSFAAEQNLCLDHLWLARRDGRPELAAMILPCAGRTALVFLSPNLRPAGLADAAALLRAACAAQDPARIRLVQGLLDPGQEVIGQALTQAGFRMLAHLLYMHRRGERSLAPLQVEPELEIAHYSRAHRDRFAQAILATYQQTLDCPGLLGLRAIDDIVEGHMATGRFTPDLWFLVHRRGEPAAVMLLNPLPQRQALELVYLGLTPAFRGRGLARRLLTHGLGLAPSHGADSMILAVDEHNTPAMRLYKQLGFTVTARKTALILPLGPAA